MELKKIGILIFNGVEILDFCGPYEVFAATRLDECRRQETSSPFGVLLVAETLEPVTTIGGMRVLPDVTLETCPPLDVLFVPGGWGAHRQMDNPHLLSFLKSRAKNVQRLVSVCTGALILGSAGLLDGLQATTHWRSLGRMREMFPLVRVDEVSNVVKAGKILTSAGISAGIDLAFKLVSELYGEEVARATARQMEYPFPKSNVRRVSVRGEEMEPGE